MNLFILDENPIVAAEYYCDKHVIKIILEAKQILDHANLIKGPYYNNPISQWVREYTDNYIWTTTHAIELCNEYTKRYYKIHSYQEKILFYHSHIPLWIPKGKRTAFYQGVAPDCKQQNTVTAYRMYYCKYKKDICKWKNGNIPEWYIESHKL